MNDFDTNIFNIFLREERDTIFHRLPSTLKSIKMKKIRWIIQENNYATQDKQALINACEKRQLAYQLVNIIPFSNELPKFGDSTAEEYIYYGSTTMMNRVYSQYNAPLGLFYNHKTFSMQNYIQQWGNYMLSSDAQFMTFGAFVEQDYPKDRLFFVRPDADSKAFAGQVLSFGDIQQWAKSLATLENNEELHLHTKIMASTPYHIEKEWRNFIVNGKVFTSSRYAQNFRVDKSATDIPKEMIQFVEARCKEYQPHDVFVMDIAKCSGKHEYYIIECGCMNAVGFYHADIDKYVNTLTQYVQKKINK